MAAFAASGYGASAHLFSKLDHRDETVSACAVPFLRSRIGARTEGSQRAPYRRSETYGDAWPSVAEGLDDISRKPLESIDVAPGRLPSAEIRCQPVRRVPKRLQQQLRRRFCADVVAYVDAGLLCVSTYALLDVFAPKNREGSRHRGRTPT